MLQKTKAIALSVVILLHLFSVQRAHTVDIYPTMDDFQLAPAPHFSADDKTINTAGSSLLPRARKPTAPRVKKVKDVVTSKTNRVRKNRAGESAAKKNETTSPRKQFPCKASMTGKKIPATAKRKSILQVGMKQRVSTFTGQYLGCTGRKLVITSKGRTPRQQAKAMHTNFKTYGVRYVIGTYRRKTAVGEIAAAFKANRRRPRKAVREMEKVILAQVRRGVFISNHLRGLALDVRSKGRNGARLAVLRQIARSMGGRVLVEKDHFHVELT